MAANRKFNWISSSDNKNIEVLNELNRKMIRFYSELETRNSYQSMIDDNYSDISNPSPVTSSFLKYLEKIDKGNILEIGCGSARIYQFIKKHFTNVSYTGIEISKNIIEKNKLRFPEAIWKVADAYNIPEKDEYFDVCFSFYVIEHLVFPEKALKEMLRVVKKNGILVLVFPDFAASGRFASQSIGFSNDPTAISKLKKGKLIDAAVSLYDSRVRLPNALKRASKLVGDFPVNLNPKCLQLEDINMTPDIDAVYISSKAEMQNWCKRNGYKISYPAGKKDLFLEQSFLSIEKL